MKKVILLVLIIGLAAGVILVKNQQDIRSKATSTTGSGWPKDPIPSDGQTGVSLSPDFSWKYETDAYPGCNTAGSYANVYLWDCAAHNDSCLVGFGGRSSDTTSVYEIPATVIHPYSSPGVLDYNRLVAPLTPNKQYWWYVTPKACGVLHFEENKAWTFTTGAPASVGVCQKVISSKDLSAIKIGDTVTFTGFGNLTNPAADDSIDKIKFIILKDGVEASNTDVTTTADSAGVWKATKDFTITAAGSYSVQIKAHWKSKDQWLL